MCAGRFTSSDESHVGILQDDVKIGRNCCASVMITFSARSVSESSEDEATRRTDRNAAMRTSSSALDHRSRQV